MNPWLLSISLAYLLGSIPFGYILVRTFRHQDIRASGSGNIGATNVARSGARGLAIATLLLDLAKGALAVLLAFQLAHRAPDVTRSTAFDLAVCAGVAAILGHVFPIWLGFKGGKGVATGLGVFLALVPLAALGAVLVFALVFAITRYVSLGSILAAALLPVFCLRLLHQPSQIVLGGLVFIPLLIILKHHANITRLIAGTESRFGANQ
jgi:glycerol-3-phosphate acyltransferase PlsY